MREPMFDEWKNKAASEQAAKASRGRAKSRRRRLVDPTVCDIDYTPVQLEFMLAMHQYIIQSGRQFPTCCEILEVLIGLGYSK